MSHISYQLVALSHCLGCYKQPSLLLLSYLACFALWKQISTVPDFCSTGEENCQLKSDDSCVCGYSVAKSMLLIQSSSQVSAKNSSCQTLVNYMVIEYKQDIADFYDNISICLSNSGHFFLHVQLKKYKLRLKASIDNQRFAWNVLIIKDLL